MEKRFLAALLMTLPTTKTISSDDPGAKPEVWSSETLPPHRQFEAFRELAADAPQSWNVAKIACERFPASVHQYRVNDLRLNNLVARGVRSTRTRAQIARDRESYLAIVMVRQGSLTLRSDGQELCLTEGTFTLWDSTRPAEEISGDGYHLMTLLVPEAQLLNRMPRARDLHGRLMNGRYGIGGLFMDHSRALMKHMGQLPAASRQGACDTSLDLLTLCLGGQPSLPPPRLRQVMLEQVQRHIETRLTDPSLGVSSLARAFSMTERNVHKLFEATGVTVCTYIRTRRLAMCRRDLEGTTLAQRHTGEIASHWGFADASHFSKVFRAAYGISPTEFRAQVRASRDA